MQSPMFQATDTINQLARERFGLRLEDAAAEVGIPDRVEKALYAAGFSNVQVHQPYRCSICSPWAGSTASRGTSCALL